MRRAVQSLALPLVCLATAWAPLLAAESQRGNVAQPVAQRAAEKAVAEEEDGFPRPLVVPEWVPLQPIVAREFLTPDELEFAKSIADSIGHALALVAADPDISLPEGSLAARVQNVYRRLEGGQRTVMRARAEALLATSGDLRAKYFGGYAGTDAVEKHRRAGAGLTREQHALLRKAVHAGMEARAQKVPDLMKMLSECQFFRPTKTTLEGGFFTGDSVTDGETEFTFNQPEKLDFRWKTEEPEAEIGRWELVGRVARGDDMVLASGSSGDAPENLFKINFGDYLPPVPPEQPVIYYVRVQPRTKAKMITQPGSQPGSEKVEKVFSRCVGPWSNPVYISYQKALAPAQVLQFTEIYRNASFYLEGIRLVEDSTESGNEEFWVSGFTQELLPTGDGQQDRYGPRFQEIDPDDHKLKTGVSDASYFNLNNPDQPQWPRAYLTAISVMESDDGGSLALWETHLWNEADEFLHGYVGEQISQYLEENALEWVQYGVDVAGWAAELVGMITSEVVAAFGGVAVAAAAFILAAVISGLEDDFYGTEIWVVPLPVNTTEYVRSLDGKLLPTGGFELTEELRFYGEASYPSASAFDGKLDVHLRWKFTGIETL